jgi:CheY-like chemotaxis protein/tetratricopeptide (TPR) repeat protein
MPPDTRSNATILLVDDDAASRAALELIIVSQPKLRALTPRVIKVLDGHRALASVRDDHPDLVITELSIPGMDGFAFCRAVRALPSGAAVPILIVSGVALHANLIADLTQELQATFLAKPVQPDLLADAIVAAVAGTGRRGSLAERGVARLLFDHLEAASTGTLVLVRGQMRKEIFLRQGQVVAAESNLRQEALGSLLVAKGVLDEQRLKFLLAETKKRGQKMGTVLVELGWLGAEDILQYLAAQTRLRVIDCLRWPDGAWSFVPGDAFGERVMEHGLDTATLLWKGLFRTAVPEDLVAQLEQGGGRSVRVSPRIEQWREAFEGVFGRHVLSVLREPATLGSLVLRDDGQGLTVALESLLVSGLAELGPAAETQVERGTDEPSEAFSLERLGSDATGRIRTLQRESVNDEWTTSTGPDLQVVASEEPDADGSTALDDLSDHPWGSFGSGPAPRTDGGGGDARSALLREYLEVHGKSYYEVLGVSADAGHEEIGAAYRTKMQRFSNQAFADVSFDGDSTSKLEALRTAYVKAFEALSDPKAREGYDTEQVVPLMSALDPLGAELAFGEGQTLLESGQADAAVERFEQAVDARPDQAAYHAYLGWALFIAGGVGRLEVARERLTRALTLDPDLGKAHELLGRLAVSTGDDATACVHLERALETEADQSEIIELLIAVHERLDDVRGAERSYRRFIAQLGERALPLRSRLWRLLAELYEARLGDIDKARIAYENAARLAPGDVTAQRKVVELNAEAPARWRESARALAAEWQLRPGDGELGGRLVDLFLKAGRRDAASVAAAAMVLRKVASDEIATLAEQGRPALLRPLSRPLDQAAFRGLAYPGEDDDLETVVAVLAEAGVIPRDAEPMGEGTRPLASSQLPAPLRKVLRYACHALGVDEPRVVISDPGPPGVVRVLDLRPCVLMVAPALANSVDTVELGFRLARALASSKPGRAAGLSRTGRQLRPYFVALLALARGDSSTPDPEANEALQRIASVPAGFKMVALEVAGRLKRGRRAIDLVGWIRALPRTADRVALLVSGDLLRVGEAVAQEQKTGALDDLVTFALSPEYLEMREDIGLGSSS